MIVEHVALCWKGLSVSINFDRAAGYYDATRGYSAEVGTQIAQAIVRASAATPEFSFLEIGVGTGRIALPLAREGYSLTGVDISRAMMERLRSKLAEHEQAGAPLRFTLVEGDMESLPFADQSFDVVIAAHVFHLVQRPMVAAREALRVLGHYGSLLICGDIFAGHEPLTVNEKWREIVHAVYGSMPNSAEAANRIITELQSSDRSLIVEESRPVRWRFAVSASEELESIRQKLWSNTWMLPDDVFDRCFDELSQWCARTFRKNMSEPQPRTAEFLIRRVFRGSAP
jgi:ubiquinone/menaquinone biosynthesis C-methylase UbiE